MLEFQLRLLMKLVMMMKKLLKTCYWREKEETASQGSSLRQCQESIYFLDMLVIGKLKNMLS